MHRRQYLTGLGVVVTISAAGCSEGENSGGTPTDGQSTETTTDTPTQTPTATDGGPTTPTETDSPTEAQGTPTAAPDYMVTVSPEENYTSFDPDSLEIAQGETVRWEWAQGGHNIRPGDIPEDSDWTGTPGGPTKTYGEGYTYQHTFQVSGEFNYYCAPHRQQGMQGTITVS